MEKTNSVPEPPGWPLLGHAVGWIDNDNPVKSFGEIADKYGPIYRLRLLRTPITFVSNYKLIHELCNERKFRKVPSGPATNKVHCQAYLEEENWGIAHRILMPAFGPAAVQGMFDEMHDIASQLAMKWARFGVDEPFNPTEDFTRLAMDTLALCSMGYRFNSFYTPETHPFLSAMARVLLTSRYRARRSRLVDLCYWQANQRYFNDIAYLRKLADDIVAVRIKDPGERKDLVAAMLNGIDHKTGMHMTDKNITDNALSFLVAGHETTAGLLSFTLYYLIKHPKVFDKARQQVDEVIGEGQMNVGHLLKLPYVTAILREVLRLEPPIPVFAVKPYQEAILGNQYPVAKNESCVLLLTKAMRDREIYGEDADEFRPERMLDEHFNNLPPGAFKPFGNGQRACIGRNFALQEATLMLAMLLQNFNFSLDDPEYTLKHRQTLTMKPRDFKVRASLRHGLTPLLLQRRLTGGMTATPPLTNGIAEHDPTTAKTNRDSGNGKPLTILFGSNSGTCEYLARRLAEHAPAHGFKADTVASLDSATGNLPKDQPVAIITTTYEGEPTDDARDFFSWLEAAAAAAAIPAADPLKGVRYSLYGLGHHDWITSFQKIPKLIDANLEKAGAQRLLPLALDDVASSEVVSQFDAWEDESFWPTLMKAYSVEGDGFKPATSGPGITVDLLTPRPETLHHDVSEAVVVDNRVLTAPGEPVKKHMEIQLPNNTEYRPGDYLVVLPINPRETVHRVMRKFQIPWDARVKITADQRTTTSLPSGDYAVLTDILEAYDIVSLVEATDDGKVKEQLRRLSTDLYVSEIVTKHTTVLDLLERYPAVDLSLAAFLALLPPMRLRRYSISSSPLSKPGYATLTYSVYKVPSTSGDGFHIGVASTYLQSLQPGDRLHVAVRPSHAAFHLPACTESTPVMMVAAGSGIAPFRGFIQQRAAEMESGREQPPAVLFYGCREPDHDDLYSDELAQWEKIGAVKVYRAYSRTPEKAHGNRYAQDALWAEREVVNELWETGARLYICGSRELEQGVSQTMVRMHLDKSRKLGKAETEDEGKQWWQGLRNKRYTIDVFD
ncbi:hypothetical protein NLU13_9656 [Sarocladium strictum]|uniref:Bifunctional cytochrome P450/NADPH--P450 reductase n=1 Tax=Sarocladium strictum TaxID=5046 RepID=A0AA39GAJ2_SARSR|nr:hypothetical protein NLU13_9656 [Sarocladium strictum]